MSQQDHRQIRRDYGAHELRREQLDEDPLKQFGVWLKSALDAKLVDATAMTLATVDALGQPSARIVLLKHHSRAGFSWYTSYASPKARELAQNPKAALLFYWREFERQVRISGTVSKLSRQDAETYFASRPEESRLAAAVSGQSSPIENRRALLAKVDAMASQYPQGNVPTPADWGGYILRPASFEFWQGREGRLHDRFKYSPMGQSWQIERLQP